MKTTYYRIQSGDRDVNQLLDTELQTSEAWHGVDVRGGVSVCETREDLAQYLVTGGSGIPFGTGGWVIVELEGDVLPADGLDAEHGELLIRPTRIVNVAEIDDDFYALLDTAYENLED